MPPYRPSAHVCPIWWITRPPSCAVNSCLIGTQDCKRRQGELLDKRIGPVLGQMLLMSMDYQTYGNFREKSECTHLVVLVFVSWQLPSVLYHKEWGGSARKCTNVSQEQTLQQKNSTVEIQIWLYKSWTILFQYDSAHLYCMYQCQMNGHFMVKMVQFVCL